MDRNHRHTALSASATERSSNLDQLLVLAVRSRQYIEAIHATDTVFRSELSHWALSVNEFDLKVLPTKDLSDIVAATAKSGTTLSGTILTTLILSEEPGVAFFLAERVRAGICPTEIITLLASAVTDEAFASSAKGAIRRALASLVLEGVAVKEDLPPAVQHLIEPLLQSHLLLMEPASRSKPRSRRAVLFLDITEEEMALVSEAREIVADGSLFREITQAISRILLQAKPDPQRCRRYYDRLMLLQDALMEFVRQKPEEVLLLLLSAQGLASDCADSLAALEPLGGHQIALWLRAGLQSEYFRAEALSALCYGYVYGLTNSEVAQQLFSAITYHEVTQDAVETQLTALFGQSILLRFQADLETFQTASPINLVTLYGDSATIRQNLHRLFQLSEEKILLDAVATYHFYFGRSRFVSSGRIKIVEARLRKGLSALPEVQFLGWGNGLLRRPHSVEVQKYLWCVHTLCTSGIPHFKVSDDCREPMIRAIVRLEEDEKYIWEYAQEHMLRLRLSGNTLARKEVLKSLWQLHQQAVWDVIERCFLHNVFRLKEDAQQDTTEEITPTFHLEKPVKDMLDGFADIQFPEENLAQALKFYQSGTPMAFADTFGEFKEIADQQYFFPSGSFDTVLVDFRHEQVYFLKNIQFLGDRIITGPEGKCYLQIRHFDQDRLAARQTPPRQLFDLNARRILRIEGRYPYDVGRMQVASDGHVHAWVQFDANSSYFQVDLTTGYRCL